MKKKIVSILLCAAMVATMAIGCGKKEAASDEADASKDGGLIKVGIINNDPNESGYRTANDKDMKEMFTEENGYEASFAYSLKNDEQITSAQKFIQDGVDYLLLSAADTSGWDSVLKDAQVQEQELSYLTVPSMQMRAFMKHLSYLIWKQKARRLLHG